MNTPGAAAARPFAWYYRPLQWLLLGLAHLPLPVLYVLADGLYVLTAHVIGYRKRVVRQNLERSFPEKPAAEIGQLTRQFYRHFTSVIVEILKLAAIRPEELKRRLQIRNPEVIDRHTNQGRTVLALGSHAGNWEWILAAGALWFAAPADGVYKPLSNPFFEYFMRRLRTRTGAQLVPMRDTLRDMIRRRGQPRTLSLLSDQSPAGTEHTYWTEFMHQDTAFYTGADKLAAQFGCPVVYVGIRRLRRGYYEVHLTELHDGQTPLDKNRSDLTEAFARCLERDLQANPADYLWSHRRWKHKRGDT